MSPDTLCALPQSIRARVPVTSMKDKSVRGDVRTYNHNLVRPNQSLNLTEPALDEFAAREFAEIEMINQYVRVANHVQIAARCRRLAPVR